MRVCFVAARVGVGGVWQDFYSEFFMYARTHGIDPILVYPSGTAKAVTSLRRNDRVEIAVPYRSKALHASFGLVNYPSWWVDELAYSLTVAPTVRELDPDAVHLISSLTTYILKNEAKVRSPLVLNAAGSAGTGSTLPTLQEKLLLRLVETPMERKLARAADHIVCLTSAIRKFYAEQIGIKPASMSVIPWGVDISKFTPEKMTDGSRDEFGSRGRFCVVSVGRMIPIKGFDILLRAVKRLADAVGYEKVKLLIVGPASDTWEYGGTNKHFNELKAYVNGNDLDEVVKFTGGLAHDRLAILLASSDAFVLASRAEGQGIVILEALASGLPVVASRVGGIPEIIGNSSAGFLFAPGNDEELFQILLNLFRNPTLRQNAKVTARQLAEAYSWERILGSLGDVYRSLQRF